MKRVWTISSAVAWVRRCDDEKQVKGLTYCSAVDFLRGRIKATLDTVGTNQEPTAGE